MPVADFAWSRDGSFAPDEFLTRSQLVEQVRERGVDVDERVMVFWERRGILPKPIRRGREVVYPALAVNVVVTLRELQQSGLTLDAIKPLMREYALVPNAKIAVGDPLRAALRFDALRLAANREHDYQLPAGSIRSATLQFKDEAGNVVAEENITWSDRFAEGVRENLSLIPWQGLRKRIRLAIPDADD